ncbi:hypothetical protein PAMP_010724 [Pampus punctatissimus]
MNGVKCANGSEDRQCPGHPKRAARGHGDTGQLTETRNHVLKKQLPPTEGVKDRSHASSQQTDIQQVNSPNRPGLNATHITGL